MENLTFTQLSIPEIRQMLRQELVNYFETHRPYEGGQPEQEEFLTIQQAAAMLKLSVATLYGYSQRAEIPVNKRGKRLYFPKSDLIEWIKQGKKKTLAEEAADADAYLLTKKKRG